MTWLARTLLGAALVAGVGAFSGAAFAQVMTVGEYLGATDAGGERAAAARRYLDGVVQGILVVDAMLEEDDAALFCVADEEAGAVDLDTLRREFGSWLQITARGDASAEVRESDVPTLALAYFASRMPCPEDNALTPPASGGAQPAEGSRAEDPNQIDMRSLLLK